VNLWRIFLLHYPGLLFFNPAFGLSSFPRGIFRRNIAIRKKSLNIEATTMKAKQKNIAAPLLNYSNNAARFISSKVVK